MVADNAHRLDTIDQAGTRGVGVVQVQLVDQAKDIAALGVRMDQDIKALSERMDAHDKRHDVEERDRRAGRRWLVTTLVGGAAALGGLYALLADVLAHLH
jgi:hypothetical protein